MRVPHPRFPSAWSAPLRPPHSRPLQEDQTPKPGIPELWSLAVIVITFCTARSLTVDPGYFSFLLLFIHMTDFCFICPSHFFSRSLSSPRKTILFLRALCSLLNWDPNLYCGTLPIPGTEWRECMAVQWCTYLKLICLQYLQLIHPHASPPSRFWTAFPLTAVGAHFYRHFTCRNAKGNSAFRGLCHSFNHISYLLYLSS